MKIREDEVPLQPLSIQYIYTNDLKAFKKYLLKVRSENTTDHVLIEEKSTTGLNILLFSVLYDRLDFVNYLFENYEFNLASTGIQAKADTLGIEIILRKLIYIFQIIERNDVEEFKKHIENLNADKHESITLSQILKWRHNGQTLYEYALFYDRIDIAISLYLYFSQSIFEVIHFYSQSQLDKITENHIQVSSICGLLKKDETNGMSSGLLTCPQAIKQIIECSIVSGRYQFAYIQIIIELLQANILIAGSNGIQLGNVQFNCNQSGLANPIDSTQNRKKAELMLLYIDCNLQDEQAAMFKEFNLMLMARQIETLSALGKGMSGIISAHPSLVLTLFEALNKQAEKISCLERQLQHSQPDILDSEPKAEFCINFNSLSLNDKKKSEMQHGSKTTECNRKNKRALTK